MTSTLATVPSPPSFLHLGRRQRRDEVGGGAITVPGEGGAQGHSFPSREDDFQEGPRCLLALASLCVVFHLKVPTTDEEQSKERKVPFISGGGGGAQHCHSPQIFLPETDWTAVDKSPATSKHYCHPIYKRSALRLPGVIILKMERNTLKTSKMHAGVPTGGKKTSLLAVEKKWHSWFKIPVKTKKKTSYTKEEFENWKKELNCSEPDPTEFWDGVSLLWNVLLNSKSAAGSQHRLLRSRKAAGFYRLKLSNVLQTEPALTTAVPSSSWNPQMKNQKIWKMMEVFFGPKMNNV